MNLNKYEHIHGTCRNCKRRVVTLPRWDEPVTMIGSLFTLGLKVIGYCRDCGGEVEDATLHQPHAPLFDANQLNQRVRRNARG